MKRRILSLLIWATLGSIFLYSSSIDINLNTNVPTTFATYNLYYQDELVTNDSADFEIETNPISEDGNTESFYIIATSNLNSEKIISLKIVTNPFYKISNISSNGKQTSSKVQPVVIFISKDYLLEPGYNKDKTVAQFYLKWIGKSNLDSGDYQSNVIINYSIE
ncbi:MAG: hypothetical protein OWP43_04695 [Sphaerochaetaceae bacterium]|nr:hypothetical protein [Sphaerochaetaceae bacterium]